MSHHLFMKVSRDCWRCGVDDWKVREGCKPAYCNFRDVAEYRAMRAGIEAFESCRKAKIMLEAMADRMMRRFAIT